MLVYVPGAFWGKAAAQYSVNSQRPLADGGVQFFCLSAALVHEDAAAGSKGWHARLCGLVRLCSQVHHFGFVCFEVLLFGAHTLRVITSSW